MQTKLALPTKKLLLHGWVVDFGVQGEAEAGDSRFQSGTVLLSEAMIGLYMVAQKAYSQMKVDLKQKTSKTFRLPVA